MITDPLLLQLAKEKNLNVTEQVKNTIENIKKENNLETDDDLKRALLSQGLEWDAWLKQVEETILRQSAVIERGQPVDRPGRRRGRRLLQETPGRIHRARGIQAPRGLLGDEGRGPGGPRDQQEGDQRQVQGRRRFRRNLGDPVRCAPQGFQGRSGGDQKGRSGQDPSRGRGKDEEGRRLGLGPGRVGWYLLKLEDKKDSRLKTFEESRKSIEEKIYNQKQSVELDKFIVQLKKKSYIKILRPEPIKG